MLTDDLFDKTRERWENRRGARQTTDAKANAEGATPLTIDSAKRVEKYLTRRGLTEVAEAVANIGGAKQPVVGTSRLPQTERLLYERVLGTNQMMAVRFLERGSRVARAVGRVRIREASGETIGYGTASLISPRLALTNNHVLGSVDEARDSWLEMGYQESSASKLLAPIPFELDPDAFFETSVDLDFTIVAVKETGIDGTSLSEFGCVELLEEEGKVLLHQTLNIVQHPNGEPKQVALRENELKDILELHLHYHTDTAPGSSGSLVCNDEWEVVALHHSGVPEPHPDGGYMAIDGSRWRSSMGEHRLKWIANEGIRISRILKDLKSRSLSPVARAMVNEIFSTPAPPSVPKREIGEVVRGTAPGAVAIETDVSPSGSDAIRITVSIPMSSGARITNLTPGVAPLPAAPQRLIERPAGPAVAVRRQGEDVDQALAILAEAKRLPYYSEKQDETDRDAYYSGLTENLDPDERYEALHELLGSTHTTEIRYKPLTHVYPWVDLHPDLKLRSIYSGREFEPEEIIREDFRILGERLARAEAALVLREGTFSEAQLLREIETLEATLPYNCEHVVPQSWFGKKEPMRGDLHHLFTCESGCNSFRGNTPYFEFDDFEEAVRDECGKRESNKFEPGRGKGAVARASLYFLLRYKGEIDDAANEYEQNRLATLLQWHLDDPVSKWELHRNAAIFRKQGNRNPLIDHPDLAGRVNFASGLG